jgi:hypothetical protein
MRREDQHAVMPALVAGVRVLLAADARKDVDCRVLPGNDAGKESQDG